MNYECLLLPRNNDVAGSFGTLMESHCSPLLVTYLFPQRQLCGRERQPAETVYSRCSHTLHQSSVSQPVVSQSVVVVLVFVPWTRRRPCRAPRNNNRITRRRRRRRTTTTTTTTRTTKHQHQQQWWYRRRQQRQQRRRRRRVREFH